MYIQAWQFYRGNNVWKHVVTIGDLRENPPLASQIAAINESGNGVPDSKVHGASMGPICGRQDPCWPHVGPLNFAIWGVPDTNMQSSEQMMKSNAI